MDKKEDNKNMSCSAEEDDMKQSHSDKVGNDFSSSSSISSLWLRIFHINDVYELDHLPSFKTVVDTFGHGNHPTKDYDDVAVVGNKDGRCRSPDATLVILAGDFVAPSLLSSIDHGSSMVDCLNACGVTHVSLGNHECDIPLPALAQRIQQSHFTWLNTNLRQLFQTATTTTTNAGNGSSVGGGPAAAAAAAKSTVLTKEYDIVTVSNGTFTKRVALLGLLTNDPGLYRPGAFGNAVIEPVISCTERMISQLRTTSTDNDDNDEKKDMVDLILPITHQSIDDDREFCEHFQKQEQQKNHTNNTYDCIFPVVLGGHDHEPYHEFIGSTQLIKVGYDAMETGITDILWTHQDPTQEQQEQQQSSSLPRCRIQFQMVPTQSYPPDPQLLQRVQDHQAKLQQLSKAKLFRISQWNPPPRHVSQIIRASRRRLLLAMSSSSSSSSDKNDSNNNNHNHTTNNDSSNPPPPSPPALFSTKNNRLGPSTGTTTLATMLRMGMQCQACLLNAGCVRGNQEYPNNTNDWFTWNDLKTELPFDSEMTVTAIPGHVLEATITYSRFGSDDDDNDVDVDDAEQSSPPEGKDGTETATVARGGYLHTCDNICYDNETKRITGIYCYDDDDDDDDDEEEKETETKQQRPRPTKRFQPLDPQRDYLVAHPREFFDGIDNHAPLLEWWRGTTTTTSLDDNNENVDHNNDSDKKKKDPINPMNQLLHQEATRRAKTVIVELCSALFWLQIGTYRELDCEGRGYITLDDVQRQLSYLQKSDNNNDDNNVVPDLILDNVWSVADVHGTGYVTQLDFMTIYYVAMDLVEHVSTEWELTVLRQIVTHVLQLHHHGDDDDDGNDNEDHEDAFARTPSTNNTTTPDKNKHNNNDLIVNYWVKQIHQRLDLSGDGKIQRTETMKALGSLRRQSLL